MYYLYIKGIYFVLFDYNRNQYSEVAVSWPLVSHSQDSNSGSMTVTIINNDP